MDWFLFGVGLLMVCTLCFGIVATPNKSDRKLFVILLVAISSVVWLPVYRFIAKAPSVPYVVSLDTTWVNSYTLVEVEPNRFVIESDSTMVVRYMVEMDTQKR